MLTRALPVLLIAVASFVAGFLVATAPGRAEGALVRSYVTAWAHRDYAHMYSLLDSGSRRGLSEARFAARIQEAAATATATSLVVDQVGSKTGETIPVQMTVRTRVWGTLHEVLQVGLAGSGSSAHIRLTAALLFPGLRGRERLRRTITLPTRGTLLAADGTPLAQGATRSSPIPSVAGQIVGTLGPIPTIDAREYAARGYPPDAQVGLDGLERIFQSRLLGTPGGQLFAGHRQLASATAIQARPVQTTISPNIELATIAAMGGQYAGITVMNPRTGALLALAGIAFSALQPPGSTMKIITASGALAAGIAKLSTTYPVQTAATIDGYSLQNANGEACGGTLINAFAVSCNSVFAPLGVQLGAKRLVAIAQRFGFDQPSSIPGAPESLIPSASKIGSALSVGSSAIGQGVVQTTPLEMADVAATIAMGGRRPIPTLLAHQRPRFVRVISGHVAREVQQMMIAVVDYGTGTAAAIPGVQVAGKTGTAELRTTVTTPNSPNPQASSPKNTDAWFVGYAPVGHPRFVVGALFPNQGSGGAAAAPPVRQILEAALSH